MYTLSIYLPATIGTVGHTSGTVCVEGREAVSWSNKGVGDVGGESGGLLESFSPRGLFESSSPSLPLARALVPVKEGASQLFLL